MSAPLTAAQPASITTNPIRGEGGPMFLRPMHELIPDDAQTCLCDQPDRQPEMSSGLCDGSTAMRVTADSYASGAVLL